MCKGSNLYMRMNSKMLEKIVKLLFFTFSEQTSIGHEYQALNDLIAELSKNGNVELYTAAFRYLH